MRFLIDVQLPRPLVAVFIRGGHVADYATDHLPATADDRQLWTLAEGLGAAIVTKDGDFADLVAARGEAIAVVWLRCGNIYNPDLYALVERHLPAIVTALEQGAHIIELR